MQTKGAISTIAPMVILKCSNHYTLCFLRHAHAENCGEDFNNPLSNEGLKQAEKARLELEKHPFDLVISSPALRAKTTAHIVAPYARVVELLSLYDLLHYAQDIRLRDILNSHEMSELSPQALQMLISCYQDIIHHIKEAQAKEILIVAHSGVINVLSSLFAKEHASYLYYYPIKNAESLILSS